MERPDTKTAREFAILESLAADYEYRGRRIEWGFTTNLDGSHRLNITIYAEDKDNGNA
jgi:hypothetical protein